MMRSTPASVLQRTLLFILPLTVACSPAAMGAALPGAEQAEQASVGQPSGTDARPMLHVPVTGSKPVIDGRLDDSCWKDAARTGPLQVTRGAPAKSTTEAFLLRDAEHLYVGLRCAGKDAMHGEAKAGGPAQGGEFAELLINSNGDRNSYYLIRIAPNDGGKVTCSYNEHTPPWHDRTWQPQFRSAAVRSRDAWTAEIALAFNAFNKNKTLASEVGFNILRAGMPGEETHCWQGAFPNPAEGGILTGIPGRERLPAPEYVEPGPWFDIPTKPRQSFLAGQEGRRLQLGPGSAHPGTTGEVRLELEGFLLAGDPHTRAIIWDLAVNEKKGELFVLSDPRPVRGIPDVRVFDRQGRYLRTIMPFHPAVGASSGADLCRAIAVEGGMELGIPRRFEISGGEISLYGAWWNLPQKMAVAPDGDLILSGVYKGTLWRLGPDGSLPRDGWTSVYHKGRNEPFDSAFWVVDRWDARDLPHYLPYSSLCYPYFCFDRSGHLYIASGSTAPLTATRFGTWWEVSSKHRSGPAVWRSRLLEGVKLEPAKPLVGLGPSSEPCGLVHDGSHLIVADCGNNCLQVFEDGRLATSITHYEHQGRTVPLHRPTALGMDGDKCLHVLVTGKVLKLKSWRDTRCLPVSEPLHRDAFQIAVDGGVTPPLVWVANGAGMGTLLQLAGDDLSLKGQWADTGETLSSPGQYGGPPILNIDPETGDLYVEDDSHYRGNMYGTVYRLSQDGKVLNKWDPVSFNTHGGKGPDNFGIADLKGHFRFPAEPRSIDSFFGKDGNVYRWRLEQAGISVLRFDRRGRPIPFQATGTNVLPVEHRRWGTGNRHDIYHGMDVDRQGNIYYVAKADDPAKAGTDQTQQPVDIYGLPAWGSLIGRPGADKTRHQVDVYDSDGNPRKKGWVQLNSTRWIQVDEQGNLYALHKPSDAPWRYYLALSKFAPSGGQPVWSRRWESYAGQVETYVDNCMCVTARLHQALDDQGYLYAASEFSVQVIDCETGKLVGEFGSYGNMDCQGKGSRFPHPELPFGTISALSVWKDRLFAVDMLNRRIVKCRIERDSTKRDRSDRSNY